MNNFIIEILSHLFELHNNKILTISGHIFKLNVQNIDRKIPNKKGKKKRNVTTKYKINNEAYNLTLFSERRKLKYEKWRVFH